MANPARPGRVRKSVKRGPGKRIVEGGSIRLADEVRISSTEQPTTTDASSRLVGWSCSRPKPAMHGCSIARQRINIAQAGNFKYVWLGLRQKFFGITPRNECGRAGDDSSSGGKPCHLNSCAILAT